MAARVPKDLGHPQGASFATCGRLPRSRICPGNFINGKEKPLHLFVECRESVGGFQAWPIAGGAPCSGTPCPSVDRSNVGPWRCRKTAAGGKVELMDNLLREFLTEIGESLDTVDGQLVRFDRILDMTSKLPLAA